MQNVYFLDSVKLRKIVSIFLTLNFLMLEIPTVLAETTFGHEIELFELKKQIETFGKSIKGEIKDTCQVASAETKTLDSTNILDSESLMKKFTEKKNEESQNSCKLGSYTFVEEKKSVDKCKEVLRLGIIDIYVQKTLAAEKDPSNAKTPLSTISGLIVDLHHRASVLHNEVQKYLFDSQISNEDKLSLTMLYLENIVVSMRDLVVTARTYQRDEFNGQFFYEDLYISIPKKLVDFINEGNDSSKMDKLIYGNNPGLDAWFFKLIVGKFARVQIVFDGEKVFKRDLQTLLKAPTAKNYLLALKWLSLQMLFSQEAKYRSILDLSTVVDVPKSCRTHVNGGFPARFTFQVKENLLDENLEELGLYFKSDERAGIFKQYFLDNANVDPLKQSYSGVLPFAEYETSKAALKNPSKYKDTFDDNNDADEAQTILASEVSQVMNGNININIGFRRYVDKNVRYRGADLWEKIVRSVSPEEAYFTVVKGVKTPFYPDRQNLSMYLAETIVRLQGTKIEDALSEQLKETLKQNVIKFDLPSLYGPKVWRDWGASLMLNWAKNESMTVHEENILKNTCMANRGMVSFGKLRICSKLRTSSLNKKPQEIQDADFTGFTATPIDIKNNIVRLLSSLNINTDDKEPMIVNGAIEDLTMVAKSYETLSGLWIQLRDVAQVLPSGISNEYAFLIDQLKSGNDWAKIRLGYLVAMDEMQNQKSGFTPSYTLTKTHRGGMTNVASGNTRCFYNNVDSKINKIEKAAAVLGINKPLTTKHIAKLLNEESKIQLWQSNVDKMDETVNYLFNVKADGEEAYLKMALLSKQTLLTKADEEKFVAENNIRMDEKEQKKLDMIHASGINKLSTFFKSLYQMQGNSEKQQASLAQFINDNEGLDADFEPKLLFLEVDNFNKMSIYRSMFKNAAKIRITKLQEQMNHICNLSDSNVVEMRELFYSLSKNQNEINKLARLPAVPKEVMEKLEEWSEHESDSMWQGLSSGALLIGGVLVGGACTVITGGLCAPVAAALILSATALQTNVALSEYNYYGEMNKRESFANEMAELGHSSKETASELHRSWGWSAFESLSIIPFVGPAGKFTSMTVRVASRTAKTLARSSGEVLLKGASKIAAEETDVILAKHVLGQETLIKSITGNRNLYEGFLGMVEKLKMGEISMTSFLKSTGSFFKNIGSEITKEAVKDVMVLETKDQVNRQTAKVVASYFGNHASGMLNLIKSYTGSRLTKAVEVMTEVKAGTTVAQNWMKLFKGGIIQTPAWLLTKFRELRYAHLFKHAVRLQKIEAELAEVVAKQGNLEEFVLKNIDDLTEIFMEIPMRKRELPYMILLQGGPHMGGLFGRRIPVLGQLADGILMRKIFNARARLVYEGIKSQARQTLGLTAIVGGDLTLKTIKALNTAVVAAAVRDGAGQGDALIKGFEKWQEEAVNFTYEVIADKKTLSRELTIALGDASQKIVLSDPVVLKRVLFTPATIAEKAISEMLWEQMPLQKLLKIDKLSDLAHIAMSELQNYKNVDEFGSFYKAMIILIMKKNPAVVEIM